MYQPATAASHRVFVFQQGHQLPLQQADVIFLTGIAVTLELIELIHCKLFQEPGSVLLCLSGDLWDLKRFFKSAETLLGPYGFTHFIFSCNPTIFLSRFSKLTLRSISFWELSLKNPRLLSSSMIEFWTSLKFDKGTYDQW